MRGGAVDEYAGRVLADRYRLPLPPSDEYDLVETRAFDTYSGQEVLVRQVPLPEVVDAEVVEAESGPAPRRVSGRTTRRPTDPAVRRAIEAAQSAAQIPDHPRLDQVFDVFADGGSLWIVSELVAARPLAALLAERPLNPYRAAEIASDVLTAVRVLHGHGWTHRNITVRTVLVCDDGRVVLTGLAAGAAEEALCGYAPVPEPPGVPGQQQQLGPVGPLGAPAPIGAPGTFGAPVPPVGPAGAPGSLGHTPPPALSEPVEQAPGPARDYAPGGRQQGPPQPQPGLPYQPGTPGSAGPYGPGPYGPGPGEPGSTAGVPGPVGRPALDPVPAPEPPYSAGSSGTSGAMPRPQQGTPGVPAPYGNPSARPALPSGGNASGDIRAARAGAIAAYRAGARAAARVTEDEQRSAAALPAPRPQDGQDGQEGQEAPGRPEGPGPGPESGAPAAPHVPGAPAAPATPQGGNQDWWAQPPQGFAGADNDADADADDDEDPPSPYRAELAGTWRDGPASWQDGPGPVPAGGTSGIPVPGGRHPAQGPDPEPEGPYYGPEAGSPYGDRPAPGRTPPALPAGFTPAPGSSGAVPALPPGGSGQGARGGHGGRGDDHGVAMARTGGDGGDAPYSGPGSGSGSSRYTTSGAYDAMRADDQRHSAQLPAVVGAAPGAGRWDDVVAGGGSVPAYRGPATPLAAERARQARIAIVGPVTERWAPEQAGPVHENWQLAPPIGPATDLWALGALLYRAVQGHAPYPEENAFELVQLVCAEPPAFAEECGPLRPVVESLLRQDPTERPDFEELRGWLRSLVRSAPEPDAGQDVVTVPTIDGRLPIVRRRGELVRRRRWGRNKNRDIDRGRHRQRRGRERDEQDERTSLGELLGEQADERYERPARYESAQRREAPQRRESPERYEPAESYERYERQGRPDRDRDRDRDRKPRSLGRTLLILILLVLVAAIVYAVMFMPKSGDSEGQSVTEASPGVTASQPPPAASEEPAPSKSGADKPPSSPAAPTAPAGNLEKGYVLRKDTEGFQVAVNKDWQRSPINDSGQVRYGNSDFTLIIVPGRDTVQANGGDPLAYQRDKERELQPFRDSSWATASGLRRINVGQQAMAEGQFTWQDSSGRQVYVRNLALIIGGRYHVIQVIGPDSQRDAVSDIYQQATSSYRATG